MNPPILMTEEYWANSHLSIARHYGQIKFNGSHYIIVDKLGRDIFECSAIAEREGREKAIEPGEPCDLVRTDMVPAYKALGRDRIIGLLKEGRSAKEINAAAGVVPETEQPLKTTTKKKTRK